MNQDVLNPQFEAYLRELREGAAALPAGEAREVVADITEHLHAAQAEVQTPADALRVLDRLGSPEQVVRAAQPTPPPAPAAPTAPAEDGRREIMALVLLVLAELFFFLWPVALLLAAAGAYCLFTSRVWSTPQKVFAFVALGLAVPAIILLGYAAWDDGPAGSCAGVSDCEDTVEAASGFAPWLVGAFLLAQLVAIGWLSFGLRGLRGRR